MARLLFRAMPLIEKEHMTSLTSFMLHFDLNQKSSEQPVHSNEIRQQPVLFK